MDAIIKDIIDDARPMVTKDMARRGYAKLGITKKPNCTTLFTEYFGS